MEINQMEGSQSISFLMPVYSDKANSFLQKCHLKCNCWSSWDAVNYKPHIVWNTQFGKRHTNVTTLELFICNATNNILVSELSLWCWGLLSTEATNIFLIRQRFCRPHQPNSIGNSPECHEIRKSSVDRLQINENKWNQDKLTFERLTFWQMQHLRHRIESYRFESITSALWVCIASKSRWPLCARHKDQ